MTRLAHGGFPGVPQIIFDEGHEPASTGGHTVKDRTVNAIIIRKWCHYGLGEATPTVSFEVEWDDDDNAPPMFQRRTSEAGKWLPRLQAAYLGGRMETFTEVGVALTRVRDLFDDDSLARPVSRLPHGVGA